MVTEDDFRHIALGLDRAVEGAHMGHPDFRVQGRIFATLRGDRQWGMVKVTPDEQQALIANHPAVFAPESGAWGQSGCTRVRLDSVDEDTLGEAITLAWRNAVTQGPTASRRPPGTAATRKRAAAEPARPAARSSEAKAARRKRS